MPDKKDDNTWKDSDYTGPSKSAQKREMLALQKMGETLVTLSVNELKKIPIVDEKLADAIILARTITARSGKKRQLQYIGKLMRNVDHQSIAQALEAIIAGQKENAVNFQQLEKLRDKLVETGLQGIEAIIAIYANADRQHLRQLLLQVKRESKQHKPPAASRKIFKYLRELDEYTS